MLNEESRQALDRLRQFKPLNDRFPLIRRAAVLVILVENKDHGHLDVLLTQRSMNMRSYPGEVSLPGGKMDNEDNGNLKTTARREAFEEIGLPFDDPDIHPIAQMNPILTNRNLLVTPFVVFLGRGDFKPILNHDEVASIFKHPLKGFLTTSPVYDTPPEKHLHHEGSYYHESYDIKLIGQHPIRFHRFATEAAPIVGVTADILICTAKAAYGAEPEFVHHCPNQQSYDEIIKKAILQPPWTDEDPDQALGVKL